MAAVKQIAQNYSRLLHNGKSDPDFFELVRKMEQVGGIIGRSQNFRSENVRFGQVPHLFFPRTTIAELNEKRDLLMLFVYFMGLLGPNGPMPLEFTSFIFQREHNDYDFSPRRFLDIINHRFIGLFYRAWKQNEQTAMSDHPETDLISTVIRVLGSGKSIAQRNDGNISADVNADLTGSPCKNAAGLETLLRRFFHFSIRICPHQLSRVHIPLSYRCIPGKRGCSELGRSIQLGSHCWSRTLRFLIKTDELTYQEGMILMPGHKGFSALQQLVARYLDKPLDYDLELNLKRETLPDPVVNGSLQLGRGIWLAGRRTGVYPLRIGASRLFQKEHTDSYRNNGKNEQKITLSNRRESWEHL